MQPLTFLKTNPYFFPLMLFALTTLFYTSPIYGKPQSRQEAHSELQALRIELEDLKYAMKSTQVNLDLLEERVKEQDRSLAKSRELDKEVNTKNSLMAQVNALEKKLSDQEKIFEKAIEDLRTLNKASTQVLNKTQELEHHLLSHEKRLDEVVKLKGTLTSLSKAMHQHSSEESSLSTRMYRVKSGDSLEKIARVHHVPLETLRKLNSLTGDKIIVGQELRLPND